MSKLRVGIIGVGNISGLHIEAYLKNPDVELCAFCDIDDKQLSKMGEKYGITNLYNNKEEMLEKEQLDAVSVCTWNSEHAPCTIAALRAGVNVICEKPMATSAKDAEEMMRAAKESGKLLMIGFVRRFGNDAKICLDFINDGSLGELYYAKANCLRRNGNPEGWFGDKSRSGGGPLIDLGVHVIDLVRYLSGRPKPVSIYGVTYQKLFNRTGVIGKPKYVSASATGHDICDVEDMASALIRFDNGMTLAVEVSFVLNLKTPTYSVELFGTKAGAKLDPALEIIGQHQNYLTNVSFEADTTLDINASFVREINHFVDCVNGKAECLAPAEDGVEMMKILDAVYESARTGHEVIIK